MAKEKCLCGDCCGCKGVHGKGLCPHPKCSKFEAVPTSDEIILYASDKVAACMAIRQRCGIGMMDAKRLFEKLVAKAAAPGKVADIMKQVGKEKPKKAEPESNLSLVEQAIERPFPDLIEDGRLAPREDQQVSIEKAVSSGYENAHVGEYGTVVASRRRGPEEAPRISDFFILDSTAKAEDILKLVSEEIFGNYDAGKDLGDAKFGTIVFEHVQGLPQPGTALPADSKGFGPSPLAQAKKLMVIKLDAGPWSWYDNLSIAMIEALVRRTGRRAWRCGWALDKQWSWVEHWRVDQKTGRGRPTETVDGPANSETTRRARERWGIDVRAAFDDLMLRAQWETLRQWLLLPRRPIPHTAFVSLLAGKLLIQSNDPDWIVKGWDEKFPGRKPEDGPLHVGAFYRDTEKTRLKEIASSQMVTNFRKEPPLLEG